MNLYMIRHFRMSDRVKVLKALNPRNFLESGYVIMDGKKEGGIPQEGNLGASYILFMDTY